MIAFIGATAVGALWALAFISMPIAAFYEGK